MNDKNKRRFLKYGVAGTAIAGAGLWRYLAAEPPQPVEPREVGILGQPLPDIIANHWINPEGEETDFSMEEVRNKWVFLKCFQNWCPGCHKHGFPTLKKVTDAFGEHPQVSILAVQTVFEGRLFNRQSALREVQLKYELPIKIGHDIGSSATDDYPETMIRFRTGGTPWIIIANPAGRIVFNDYHLNADRFISYLKQKLAA